MNEDLSNSTVAPGNIQGPARSGMGLVLVFLFVIVGLLAWNTFRAEKWEYKIEAVNDLTFTTDINKLGEDGWELVFARRASAGSIDTGVKTEFSYEMIFKRRR